MRSISIKHILFTAALLFVFTLQSDAQSRKPVTKTIWVAGTCDMCKERIEKALDTPGVLFADYTLSEHSLEVIYKPHKISEDKIHELLNAVGHDTEKSKASDAEYGAIHECCRYRDHDCSKH